MARGVEDVNANVPKREKRNEALLPESGWEREAAGPVGSRTPTAVSPAPGQTLDRNPQETPPAGRRTAEATSAEIRRKLGGDRRPSHLEEPLPFGPIRQQGANQRVEIFHRPVDFYVLPLGQKTAHIRLFLCRGFMLVLSGLQA